MIRKLTKDEVTFTLHVEPDDVPVRGNALASGDDTIDREAKDNIITRLDNGDVWAWCHVTVRARWGEFTAVASLGGCSYESEAAFRKCPYFADLCTETLDELNTQIAAAYKAIAPLVHPLNWRDD